MEDTGGDDVPSSFSSAVREWVCAAVAVAVIGIVGVLMIRAEWGWVFTLSIALALYLAVGAIRRWRGEDTWGRFRSLTPVVTFPAFAAANWRGEDGVASVAVLVTVIVALLPDKHPRKRRRVTAAGDSIEN